MEQIHTCDVKLAVKLYIASGKGQLGVKKVVCFH